MKGDWRAGQYVLYIAHLDKKEHVFCPNGEYWRKDHKQRTRLKLFIDRHVLLLVRVPTTRRLPVTIPGRAGARPYRRRFSESAPMAQ
jgi:hypothetical protein